jgi:hypothetical protein
VRSPDFEIFRRRFSAVAHDFELDLLTFIERGQAGLFHSRNVNKHVLSATLWLNESIAFGRIEPLHGTGRHQNSPRDERTKSATLHILVIMAIPGPRDAAALHIVFCDRHGLRITGRRSRQPLLVNRRCFVCHLDCFPISKVPDGPARFQHDPSPGPCTSCGAALCDFLTIDNDEDVFAIIMKLTNGVFTHLCPLDSSAELTCFPR